MLVLARVLASTCFTITAQYRPYLPSGEGKVPGTTTDPAGTRPWSILPLARSKIRVLAPMNTPMEMTAFSSTITPSTISERAPMKQSSSMIVGVACSGSLEAFSFNADYRFNVHFDVYAGAMYSGVHDGFAAGYLATTNINPTIGIRYKF